MTIAVRLVSALMLCAVIDVPAYPQAKYSDSQATFKSDVNVVLVPVVVRDRRGQPVGNLKRENFKIFDRGKLQTISGFTAQTRTQGTPGVAAAATTSVATPTTPSKLVKPERFTAFLFDDLHLEASDAAQLRKAAVKMLDRTVNSTDWGAVITTSGSIAVPFMPYGAPLRAGIAKIRSQPIYHHAGRDCPEVSYYMADQILNKDDSIALAGAAEDAVFCGHVTGKLAEQMARQAALEALVLGKQLTLMTLRTLDEVIKTMAFCPGQRTLVLISPGFFTSSEENDYKSHILDNAARGQVTVSTLDARGLYIPDSDASEVSRLSPQETRVKSQYHAASMSVNQDVMVELAEGTGGTFFHNNNDLAGGLTQLAQGPEYVYLIEFAPQDMKPDGSYHKLKVAVDASSTHVQARRGYFAAKIPKPKKKERGKK